MVTKIRRRQVAGGVVIYLSFLCVCFYGIFPLHTLSCASWIEGYGKVMEMSVVCIYFFLLQNRRLHSK